MYMSDILGIMACTLSAYLGLEDEGLCELVWMASQKGETELISFSWCRAHPSPVRDGILGEISVYSHLVGTPSFPARASFQAAAPTTGPCSTMLEEGTSMESALSLAIRSDDMEGALQRREGRSEERRNGNVARSRPLSIKWWVRGEFSVERAQGGARGEK